MKAIIIAITILFSTAYAKENTTEKEYSKYDKATLAGGCFWCMEPPYEKLPGIYEVVSGYSGGSEEYPKYEDVAGGKTGHREAVTIYFDPKVISYKKVIDIFWKQINPTDSKGQFVDRGFQYSSAIYYHSKEQKNIAEKSKQELNKSKRYKSAIITPIIEFKSFYKAEEYHQDYYRKNPLRYKYYRWNSGRDQYLEKTWKDDKS